MEGELNQDLTSGPSPRVKFKRSSSRGGKISRTHSNVVDPLTPQVGKTTSGASLGGGQRLVGTNMVALVGLCLLFPIVAAGQLDPVDKTCEGGAQCVHQSECESFNKALEEYKVMPMGTCRQKAKFVSVAQMMKLCTCRPPSSIVVTLAMDALSTTQRHASGCSLFCNAG